MITPYGAPNQRIPITVEQHQVIDAGLQQAEASPEGIGLVALPNGQFQAEFTDAAALLDRQHAALMRQQGDPYRSFIRRYTEGEHAENGASIEIRERNFAARALSRVRGRNEPYVVRVYHDGQFKENRRDVSL
jgi:hypothetical protein